MAGDINILVAPMGVDRAFDDKYKKSLPDNLLKLVNGYIDGQSAFSSGKPSGKSNRAFYLETELFELAKKQDGDKITLSARIHTVISNWPQKVKFAYPRASSQPVRVRAGELDDGVDRLVTELLKVLVVKQIVPTLIKKLQEDEDG
jgi:hypothetical protein